MSDQTCEHCPVPPGATCLAVVAPEDFGYYCAWAASGDDLKRRAIVGRSRIGLGADRPTSRRRETSGAGLLAPERLERQRAAESCPHRDCVGCGCQGCRCLPEGRRPGQVVTIRECLACVDEAARGAVS